MDISVWFCKAVRQTEALDNGAVFCLKDLFNGADWTALPKGDRLQFGKFFKNEVNECRVQNIIYIGKADNNSALYKKEI